MTEKESLLEKLEQLIPCDLCRYDPTRSEVCAKCKMDVDPNWPNRLKSMMAELREST